MSKSWRISRRTMLRGLGTTMALPLLDIMRPARALGAPAVAGAVGANGGPLRMSFWFIPNGVIVPDWTPRQTGRDYDLPFTLEPLANVKDEVCVLSGLMHDKARANGDGAGDHARCAGAFLTGAQPRKTAGADIKLGVSVDQAAAQRVGKHTTLPSLELGLEAGRNAGQCDSGYSCAYSSNISWKSETTPMAKEINPQLVFERLFGAESDKRRAAAERVKQQAFRSSVLDYVAEDRRKLMGLASKADVKKLDEYFNSVRELEQRLDRARNEDPDKPLEIELPDAPAGIPREFQDHARLMADMIVLAFQTDMTRINTFMLGNAGSNRAYRSIGVPEGHHGISHHGRDQAKIDMLRKIDRHEVEQFAYFLEKLRSIKEGNGSLLDSCMIVFGSAIADGNRHTHHDLPVLLAGRGGGTIDTGRHIAYPRETPMNNLFLSMLDRMGAPVDSLGDSTGRLPGLEG